MPELTYVAKLIAQAKGRKQDERRFSALFAAVLLDPAR